MIHLLGAQGRELLAQLASTRVLLAFDFDGTLAPIVELHDRAQMRRRTSELFQELCELYPCAVISGRRPRDLRARLGSARPRFVLGHHGLDPGSNLKQYRRDVARARATMVAALADAPGVYVEDKDLSLAIHYRRARNKRLARLAIAAAIGAVGESVRAMWGKCVVNVIAKSAPNKGDALARIRAEQGADTALYVGDDVADEDVFQLDQPGRLLSVRVGLSKSSAAPYYLRDQREIDRLLGALIAHRRNGQ